MPLVQSDILDFVSAKSFVIKNTAFAQVGVLSFQLQGEPDDFVIDVEDELVLVTGAERYFGGIVRTIEPQLTDNTNWVVLNINAQDYSTLPGDDVIDGDGVVEGGDSDVDVITYLFSGWGTKSVTIGAEVQEVSASLPTLDFTGMTLAQALDEICKLTGASWYVDYYKQLHYFVDEADAAPFNLSDEPNGVDTFGYKDLSYPTDSVDLRNAVLAIGGEGLAQTWYTDAASITEYGRREATIKDERITNQDTLDAYAAAYLAEHATPRRSGSLTTFKAGLHAGMTVQITNALYGLAAETFRVQQVTTTYATQTGPVFSIDFGDEPLSLARQMANTSKAVAEARGAATSTAGQLADLTVAGANSVVNSSFESGSSQGWTVGSQWAFGFASADPFNGSKTSRISPTGTNTGELVTTDFISVFRDDDWYVSFWSNLSARTAGTAKADIREYDAADALLATTTISIAAAEGDWTRHSVHFGPNSVNRTAFHADTVKLKIAFYADGSPTLTWEIDGVQVERGKLITAYAPKPSELVDGQVGTTQIADDAVTTAKVIANAIVSGKIAAGSITSDKLSAALILVSLLKTANSGRRVEFDSVGIRLYDTDETLLVNIPTDESDVYVKGTIRATNLTITGDASLEGQLTIPIGGNVLLQGAHEAPPNAPSLSITYESQGLEAPSLANFTWSGGYYDASGGASGATPCWVALVRDIDTSTSYIYEWKLSDGTIDRITTVGFYNFLAGFVTRIGSSWFIAGRRDSEPGVLVLSKHNRSDGVLTAALNVTADFWFASEYGWPIKNDGTHLYIYGPSSDNNMRFVKYNTSLVKQSTVELTEPAIPSPADQTSPYEWNFEIADLGSGNRFFASLIHYRVSPYLDVSRKIYEVNMTTGAIISNTEFDMVPGADLGGMFYDGTNFKAVVGARDDAPMVKTYSNWLWTTESPVYWVGTSWYDSVGTTHETTISPRASITMTKRGSLLVSYSDVPGIGGADEPDNARIYMERGAADPGAGNLKLQSTTPDSSDILSTFNTGGAADGGGTPFPAGTASSISNQSVNAGDWFIAGDGRVQIIGQNAILLIDTVNDIMETDQLDVFGSVTVFGDSVNTDTATVWSTGGTAFPVSPVTDDQFYRTDLGLWFFYDGTRWLSTTLFTALVPDRVGGTFQTGLTATTGAALRAVVPDTHGGSDLFIESLRTAFFISGGTALSASHKWTGTFDKIDTSNAATTLATVTIDSGSSSVWRKTTNTIDAVLTAGSYFAFNSSWTKTGTPGNLVFGQEYAYRIVAT